MPITKVVYGKQTARLLLLLLVVLLVSSCTNRQVRWRHPTPSAELLQKALADLHGYHVYRDFDHRDLSLLNMADAREMLADNRLIAEDTPPFVFIEVNGKTLSIVGYNPYYRPRSQNYRSPMLYYYTAELRNARYTLPHMAPNSGDLTVTTRPLENIRIWLLNEQQWAYPDFDGTLKFNSWAGNYERISAFTTKAWDSIF